MESTTVESGRELLDEDVANSTLAGRGILVHKHHAHHAALQGLVVERGNGALSWKN